jgi:hypothetical protein
VSPAADRLLQEPNGIRELINRLLDYRIIHSVGSALTHKSVQDTFNAYMIDIGAYAILRKLEGRLPLGVWTRLVRFTSRDWVLATATPPIQLGISARYHQLNLIENKSYGGEGGIRTLGTGVSPYNGLAKGSFSPPSLVFKGLQSDP